MILNVAKRKSLLRKWLRYDGMKHEYVPVKVKAKDYKLIGGTKDGKLKFYMLIK